MNFVKKIISWIKIHPRISIVIFVLFFFILILFFSTGNNKTNLIPSPGPTENPQGILLPTIYPQTGNIQIGGSETAVSLFFNEQIDPSTVQVQSIPSFAFKVGVLADYPNRILLTPQQSWSPGTTYTITILKGLKTVDGQKELKQDIVIKYFVQPVPTPQFME